ncbi:MAG: hypothetical protein ABII90_03010 [Bacteroidota bacterium]
MKKSALNFSIAIVLCGLVVSCTSRAVNTDKRINNQLDGIETTQKNVHQIKKETKSVKIYNDIDYVHNRNIPK